MSVPQAAVRRNEKWMQAAVERLLRTFAWRCYHTWNSMRSVAGFPDLIAVRGSRLLAIELKGDGGTLGDAQRQWLDALQEAGAETFVWWPADLDTIVELLR